MRDRPILGFLIALLAVLTAIPLLHSWYTTTDDIYAAIGIQEGWRSPWFFDARRSGRLQHVFSGQLMPLAYGWGSYWLMKAIALATLASNVAALFFLLRLITREAWFGLLVVTFFFGFAQNTFDHNLLTAYPFILSMALTLFLLSVAAWWLTVTGERRLAALSVVLYTASLLVYENFLPYGIVFPVLALAASSGPWRPRLLRAARTPHIVAMGVVLAAVVAFRLLFQYDAGREAMDVEQYRLNLDPVATWNVIERYGSAAMPLHYSRVYRPLVNDFYLGFGSFRVKVFEMFEVFDAGWMARASIVAFLTGLFTWRRTPVARRGLLWFLALTMLVLSNLPIALTAKYQTWVIDRYSHGYLTVYFAYFGAVLVLALLVHEAVRASLRVGRSCGGVVAGILITAAFLTTYGTDFMNAHVALAQRQLFDRWQAMDAWIRSPEFAALPPGSLILAPTLFERYPGTVHVYDDYWTRYVLHHGRKPIEIVRFEADWRARAADPALADRLYHLKVLQLPRERVSYLALARVAPVREGAPLLSDDVSILVRARSEYLRLIGRLADVDPECRARVLVDGMPGNGTFLDYFAAHVDRIRDPREWHPARITSEGGLMVPESIALSTTPEPLDAAVEVLFDRGFYADEVQHRWADSESVIVLRNGAGREITAELRFEAKAPGVAPAAMSRFEARAGAAHVQWSIGREPQVYTMRLTIPASSSVPVTFTTDAPVVDSPLDLRRLVVMFHQGLRVRELGCGDH